MMNIVYRVERGVLSLVSNAINKLVMFLSGISYGKGFRSCGTILYRRYGGTMKIGKDVSINSHLVANPIGGQNKTVFCVTKGGKLIIGNRVGISNTAFYAAHEIIVEDDAVIGAGCKIYDTDFHSTIAEYRLNGNTNVKGMPVRIGRRSFIGGHSIILKGVSIGEQAVVAAGSVVTKSVPANEIWGGNPAKFLKKIEQ
jgi:serine acetyltransferase